MQGGFPLPPTIIIYNPGSQAHAQELLPRNNEGNAGIALILDICYL